MPVRTEFSEGHPDRGLCALAALPFGLYCEGAIRHDLDGKVVEPVRRSIGGGRHAPALGGKINVAGAAACETSRAASCGRLARRTPNAEVRNRMAPLCHDDRQPDVFLRPDSAALLGRCAD